MKDNNKNESAEKNELPENKQQQSTESNATSTPQGESSPITSNEPRESDELPQLVYEEIIDSPAFTLSRQQAGALSKWVITSEAGIQSADGEDDIQKVAFLMIVKALAFERDHTAREDIFMEIEKTVFNYTAAADHTRERFIQHGLVNLDAMVRRGQMPD